MDLTGPWFITFYVSWWHRFPDAFYSYEDVVLGGPESILTWLEGLGIEVSKQALDAAIDAAKAKRTRFNVGVSGRGDTMLPADCKATLQRLAAYYPDVDFSRIGL